MKLIKENIIYLVLYSDMFRSEKNTNMLNGFSGLQDMSDPKKETPLDKRELGDRSQIGGLRVPGTQII